MVDHSVFGCDDFIESFRLKVESFGNFVYLLVFHHVFCVSLGFYLLEFSPVGPFDAFDFLILLMDFFVKLVLPINLCIHEVFLEIFELLLGLLVVCLRLFLSCSLLFLEIFILDPHLVQQFLAVSLIIVCSCELILQT